MINALYDDRQATQCQNGRGQQDRLGGKIEPNIPSDSDPQGNAPDAMQKLCKLSMNGIRVWTPVVEMIDAHNGSNPLKDSKGSSLIGNQRRESPNRQATDQKFRQAREWHVPSAYPQGSGWRPPASCPPALPE